MRAVAILSALAALAVLLAAGKTSEQNSRVTQSKTHRFVSDHYAREPERFLASIKTPKNVLALHMGDHHWIFTKGLSLKERLSAYKMIRNHDDYIISHPTGIPYSVLRHHKRERIHALAHIKKIRAKLHPVFHYPWWWVPLGICETGVNPPDPAYGSPGHPGGDGFEGWINFAPSTWVTYGGGRYGPHAYDATEYEQYLVTLAMHRDVPWSQSNPACSARLGM